MLHRRELASGVAFLAGLAALRVMPAAAQSPGGQSASALERILSTKKLRIAVVPSEPPYFKMDPTTGKWGGFCVVMARDIAANLGVEVETVESTWNNSVLDLESNKVDMAFGLNPTPKRALVIDFPPPLFYNTSSIVCRKGFRAETWEELDKPEVRIAVDIGTSREVIVKRYASHANITSYRTSSEGLLAVLSGRADCFVATIFLALAARKGNANLGDVFMPKPHVRVVTTAAIQYDSDSRFRRFIGAWIDFNRGTGQMQEWVLDALADMGIARADLPSDIDL